MLTRELLDKILDALPRLCIGVLGDLFLDRYLDLDATLTEPSVETGLDAYQVVSVRNYPGAAGTVINNLAALGVRTIVPVSVIGDDGEGWELRWALGGWSAVRSEHLLLSQRRLTPTYTKPMLARPGEPARELNRIDIKNRTRLPAQEESQVIGTIEQVWPEIDALAVLDQVSEEDCGVVTGPVRSKLEELARTEPKKVILADSRARIGRFRGCWLKPNESECRQALGAAPNDLAGAVSVLAREVGRPVFCTSGEKGIVLVDPRTEPVQARHVPAYRVSGPLDLVGAGDSVSAGILSALAAGSDLAAAAAFGNLVASITIQQLGVTGTATPEQIRARWDEVSA